MATEAQIEANRRNSRRSTGPRSEQGKNRSRFNALGHGCRANVLVLPTEDFGEYEQEANAWKHSWKPRNPSEELALAPQDAAAARQWLLDLVDRTTEQLRQKVEVLRELAELDAAYTADRLSWDDTDEGERLRRYDLSCNRTLLRMFELLLKVRRTGEELDLGTIASIGRSVASGNMGANDRLAPAVAAVITPPAEPVKEPDPPIEANPVREGAPNEANSDVQVPSSPIRDGHKEFRIDTPHLDRKAGGFGITGKEKMHPALRRLQTGGERTFLDLSSIFDGQ
jgi:hypothetical protein